MKRIVLVTLIALLLISGCTKKATYSKEPNATFTAYMDELFVEIMSENIIDLYFNLTNYQQYGIAKPDVTLGTLLYTQEDIQEINHRLNTLQSFDYSSLDQQQQLFYNHFETRYKSIAKEYNHEFSWQFNPSSGLTASLLTIFMEYKFKDEERLMDYLVLLQDVDRLLNDAIELTKKQAALGIFMNDRAIDATNESIGKFTSAVETNQLIRSFDERIDAVTFLTEEQKQSYKVQNKTIVLDEVLTSFSAVRETLISLKGSNKYEGGLVHSPKGKSYYESIVAAKVGTTKSPAKLYKQAQTYLEKLIKKMRGKALTEAKAFEEYSKYRAEATDPSVVINNLIETSNTYFLAGPKVEFTASFLDESITDERVSAYYLIPEYDTPENNIIRINPASNKANPLDMYLTLAHEGYPGHMYQMTYFYDAVDHPLASSISQIGYTEGWAMYASLYAYDMLEFENDFTAELFKFDVRANYTINAILDIGVNYYGWDVETMLSEVAKLGFDFSKDMEVAESIYYSVIQEPGQILPYGLGLMYFDGYLEEAEAALKDKLDLKKYHQMLVETGPISFDTLDEIVKRYIKEYK